MDSLYYGEHQCHCGHTHFHDVDGSVRFDADVLAQFLRNIYKGFDTDHGIEATMWREVLRIINEGTVEGLAKAKTPPTHEQDFYEALRHSNEVFAAFKVHTMGVEMASKLHDADGKLKPFGKWVEDVGSISSHQVGSWLQTEYDTAVIRAHAAADWREFERNKNIMPNLRWMPTTSKEPESSHRAYWQMKLTLPVDDPFWEEHHPGDRWNCKCSLEATDDPVVRPVGMEPTKPQRGLENNPGKDGHTFSDKHPYFPNKCSQCFAYKKSSLKNRLKYVFHNREKDCYDCPFIDGCLEKDLIKEANRKRLKEIRSDVAPLKQEVFTNKDFPHDMTISGAGIKEWLNQPHKHFREKNEMLYHLGQIIAESKYLGWTIDGKTRNDVVRSHLFETKIGKDKTWIIVHEMTWHTFQVHSISDGEKVLTGIQK